MSLASCTHYPGMTLTEGTEPPEHPQHSLPMSSSNSAFCCVSLCAIGVCNYQRISV